MKFLDVFTEFVNFINLKNEIKTCLSVIKCNKIIVQIIIII